MIHSLLNGIMSGPWFAIIVLAFIVITGIIAAIRAITKDDDDDECECHKHSKYDNRYNSLEAMSGSLKPRYCNDLRNPLNINGPIRSNRSDD